jgi:hypothetical protein
MAMRSPAATPEDAAILPGESGLSGPSWIADCADLLAVPTCRLDRLHGKRFAVSNRHKSAGVPEHQELAATEIGHGVTSAMPQAIHVPRCLDARPRMAFACIASWGTPITGWPLTSGCASGESERETWIVLTSRARRPCRVKESAPTSAQS